MDRMKLISGNQSTDILLAIVGMRDATISDVLANVRIKHKSTTHNQVRNTMKRHGVTLTRVKGTLHKFHVPESVINAVDAWLAGRGVVESSRINTVWTPPMLRDPTAVALGRRAA